MRAVQIIFYLLSKVRTRSQALFEPFIVLFASIAQWVTEPWCSGLACSAESLKNNYLRRLEARTRSVEAEAEKKTAEAQLAFVRAAHAFRAVVCEEHETNPHLPGKTTRSKRFPPKRQVRAIHPEHRNLNCSK